MIHNTSDVSDALHPNVQYAYDQYYSYGACSHFEGEIVTIKCFEDNSLIRQMVAEDGKNKILVIDAGGSKRCAMLGDMLAAKAVANNWAGMVMYGMIRDSAQINTMNIGVKALGTHPLKSVKKGLGEHNVIVHFSGVTFTPGEYLYADNDGIITVSSPLYLS